MRKINAKIPWDKKLTIHWGKIQDKKHSYKKSLDRHKKRQLKGTWNMIYKGQKKKVLKWYMENENNMCKWIGVEIQDLSVRDEKKITHLPQLH